MVKLMDIIKNWNKGKEAHDKRVLDHEAAINTVQSIIDEIQKQVHIEKVRILLTPIKHWCKEGDKNLEAKHWQILAEYAADQVKALTKPEITSSNAITTIDGGTLQTIIERAEKRHGYGIK